jgi:YihY family inner membrane protein
VRPPQGGSDRDGALCARPDSHFIERCCFLKKLVETAKEIYRVYLRQHVGRSAAAMAYYITISLFPLLICAYAILTSLNLSATGLFGMLGNIVPEGVREIITEHLIYVSGNTSTFMIIVGATVSITSAASVFRTIMSIMADLQGKPRFTGILWYVYSFGVSVGLLLAIFASGVVIMSGEWFIRFLDRYFDIAPVFYIWQWLRFAVLFVLLLGAIYFVYRITAPREGKTVRRLPGAGVAAILLVGVSAVFSRLVTESVNYPVVYGSLASFIILLFWVYICSLIVIMGNVFNIVVFQNRKSDA